MDGSHDVLASCSATVANLQQKLEQVQATNALMKEDLAIAKNTILALQQENEELTAQRDLVTKDLQKQIEVRAIMYLLEWFCVCLGKWIKICYFMFKVKRLVWLFHDVVDKV